MAHLSPDTIEAKLIAQRQVLAQLLAQSILDPDNRAKAADAFMRDGFVPQDMQEDPGAVPDEAFAIEAGIAEEKRLIVEEARRMIESAQR
jgi:hypothetical protein